MNHCAIIFREVINMEKLIYMTPKQPFFVTSSQFYSKYIMNKFGIVHFYQCITDENLRYAIPDGCVDMIFCCDPVNPQAYICGTVLEPKAVLIRPNCCYFGVRFLPAYNPVLENSILMKELVGHMIPFDSLIQDNKMFYGICSTTDFNTQIQVFLHSYMSIYQRIRPMENNNLLVLHTANLMIRSCGCITIEKIAEETGYTSRYINKCFQSETGLSPKQFSKIIRFQAAVSALNEPVVHSLTEIANNLGYFDQSHFIHDFKQFTGFTPKKYQFCIENNKFRQRLNVIDEILL